MTVNGEGQMQGTGSGAANRRDEPGARDETVIPGPTGQPMVVKISGSDSRGAYSLIEYQHAPGAAGPPPHIHREHEEAFYVIHGELTLAIGTATIIVGPGQSAVVPRGIVHQPSNTSGKPVRFLFLTSPPMDQFFVRLGALVAEAHGRPGVDKLRELGEQHDAIFTGLPAAEPFTMYNERP